MFAQSGWRLSTGNRSRYPPGRAWPLTHGCSEPGTRGLTQEIIYLRLLTRRLRASTNHPSSEEGDQIVLSQGSRVTSIIRLEVAVHADPSLPGSSIRIRRRVSNRPIRPAWDPRGLSFNGASMLGNKSASCSPDNCLCGMYSSLPSPAASVGLGRGLDLGVLKPRAGHRYSRGPPLSLGTRSSLPPR